MRDAVRDLVLRMTGGRADLAGLCAEVTADIAEGSVCRPVSKDEAALLSEVRSIVAVVERDTPPDEVSAPFVLCGNLLYTRRNWLYETRVRTYVERAAAAGTDGAAAIPDESFFANCGRDRGGNPLALDPRQKSAIVTMCRERFSILTGGPGMGKTFTVAQAARFVRARSSGLRLGLAAPTGKAAMRMMESMRKEMEDVPPATTLHTLLGTNFDLVSFRHDHDNPLPLDWLIVDEASMIGLPMMAKLMDALPDTCRLTLVGDVDQLASVERGHVFGDLCTLAAMRAKICRLDRSWRFLPDGEIARLAAAVNGNRPDDALAILKAGSDAVDYVDISAAPAFAPRAWPKFLARITAGFEAFSRAGSPADALAHINDFRILCAVRKGPYGVDAINRFVATALGQRCPRPVMITQNDRTFDVANGDVGVIMPDDDAWIHLPVGKDGTRAIRVELLPQVETAFATTVHKSQGSEFADVAIVLPPHDEGNPLLTREILYTGITRTKRRAFVYAGDPTIRCCCRQVVSRVSGLRD